jgi:hypothetical protein
VDEGEGEGAPGRFQRQRGLTAEMEQLVPLELELEPGRVPLLLRTAPQLWLGLETHLLLCTEPQLWLGLKTQLALGRKLRECRWRLLRRELQRLLREHRRWLGLVCSAVAAVGRKNRRWVPKPGKRSAVQSTCVEL